MSEMQNVRPCARKRCNGEARLAATGGYADGSEEEYWVCTFDRSHIETVQVETPFEQESLF